MKKLDKNVLDSDHVGRLLLTLTMPAFFAMAVNTLYNIVDTIFIGQYVGPLGIAGLALVFPIQILSIGIGLMAGMGGASLISRMLGAGRISRAARALGNSITITAVLSLLVTVVGLLNEAFLCRLLGATDNTVGYTSGYLHIILIGLVFMTFSMTLSTVIRADGNAKVPMIGMIIGAGLNIVLDAVFIIPLHMGTKGAAWATIIAQFVSVVYFFYYYLFGKPEVTFKLADLKPEWKVIGEIFAVGVSALGMTLAGSLSAVVVNRTVVSFGGDFAMSAYGIVNRVMMFVIMPAIVTGQGLQPIIGFNYGAMRYDRVMRGIKIGVTATTLIGITVFLLVFFFPGYKRHGVDKAGFLCCQTGILRNVFSRSYQHRRDCFPVIGEGNTGFFFNHDQIHAVSAACHIDHAQVLGAGRSMVGLPHSGFWHLCSGIQHACSGLA